MKGRVSMIRVIACLMLMLSGGSAWADGLMVRPQAGIGVLDGKQYEHVGMRLMSNVTDVRRYGLELSYLNSSGNDYVAAGIVLEQRLYGWLNMSIGTIGYFGQGSGSSNYPGIVANIGWEPESFGSFRPFIALRNDVLFTSDKTLNGSSISAGMAFEF